MIARCAAGDGSVPHHREAPAVVSTEAHSTPIVTIQLINMFTKWWTLSFTVETVPIARQLLADDTRPT